MTTTRRLARLVLFFVALFVACPAWTAGCGAHADKAQTTSAAIGIDWDPFPPRESIDYAMDNYLSDPASARARDPVSLDQFFGSGTSSMNMDKLRVELLNPNPRFSDRPIAALHAYFANGDLYWNDRFKDVQLFRLVDATGASNNPFPEAMYVRNEGSSLIRIWGDFTSLNNGAPADLQGDALLAEVARIAVWGYVSGNVDGPASNGNNGGFAHFLDPSGRMFWRGVLIDQGAAWNTPDSSAQPWNTNILGTGPVQASSIPEEVTNSLIQIARSSADNLAGQSFDVVDDGARTIVRGIRGRAQEVLNYYGIAWQ